MAERVWSFNLVASVDVAAEVKASSPRAALELLAHNLQAALIDIDPTNHRKVAFTDVNPPTLRSGRLIEVMEVLDDSGVKVDPTRYE